jgi:hypothetical protein
MSLYETEIKAVGLSFRHVKNELKANDKVKLVHEKDNKYDPNAVAIQTLDGEMLGYVGKKDKLRTKILKRVQTEEVTMPVIIANYYKEGDEKLWDLVEEGYLVQLWLRAYSKTPLDDDSFVEIESFTGEKVLWSEYLHVCTDLNGRELMGGSTYASLGQKEFDSENIAKAWAKKNEHSTADVLAFWNDLSQISMDYGTAVHKGMELYSKHHKAFGNDALPRVPHLREAVKKFLEVSNLKDCIAEPLITDVEMGMSGWIDNLRFTSKKSVIIEDFKTNTFKDDKAYYSKWEGKLKDYKKQMDYYGTILENFGYRVETTIVWHWYQGKWNKHELGFNKVKEYSRVSK